MFKIKEFVPTSQIWLTAEDHVDRGPVPGLLRGYNIEVECGPYHEWLPAEWIKGDPETYFNSASHLWSRRHAGLKPTGRITFRGYGAEDFDEVSGVPQLIRYSDAYVKKLLAQVEKEKRERLGK